MKLLVAVYGTLKKGHYNNANLLTSEYVKEAEIPGVIWKEMGANYPRAIYNPSAMQTIKVELYNISPRIMHQLARLEVPYGYIPQLAYTTDDEAVIMWASVEPPTVDCTIIKDGNYVG